MSHKVLSIIIASLTVGGVAGFFGVPAVLADPIEKESTPSVEPPTFISITKDKALKFLNEVKPAPATTTYNYTHNAYTYIDGVVATSLNKILLVDVDGDDPYFYGKSASVDVATPLTDLTLINSFYSEDSSYHSLDYVYHVNSVDYADDRMVIDDINKDAFSSYVDSYKASYGTDLLDNSATKVKDMIESVTATVVTSYTTNLDSTVLTYTITQENPADITILTKMSYSIDEYGRLSSHGIIDYKDDVVISETEGGAIYDLTIPTQPVPELPAKLDPSKPDGWIDLTTDLGIQVNAIKELHNLPANQPSNYTEIYKSASYTYTNVDSTRPADRTIKAKSKKISTDLSETPYFYSGEDYFDQSNTADNYKSIYAFYDLADVYYSGWNTQAGDGSGLTGTGPVETTSIAFTSFLDSYKLKPLKDPNEFIDPYAKIVELASVANATKSLKKFRNGLEYVFDYTIDLNRTEGVETRYVEFRFNSLGFLTSYLETYTFTSIKGTVHEISRVSKELVYDTTITYIRNFDLNTIVNE
jgi:hypothetical protein